MRSLPRPRQFAPVLASACAVLIAALVVPLQARAVQQVELTPELREAAIAAAERDPDVRTRMRLRPGPYRVHAARAYDTGGGLGYLGFSGGDLVELQYEAGDGSRFLNVLYDGERDRVEATGQVLLYMPDHETRLQSVTATPGYWISALIVLALLLAAGRVGRRGLVVTVLPFGAIAVFYALQVQNWIPADGIREWNIALFGGFTASMLVSAVAAWWVLARNDERPVVDPPRLPAGVSVALICIGTGLTALLAHWVRMPIDVAQASWNGAELMAGGARVYGGADNVPWFVSNSDTYGPVAYLAYLPGALMSDDLRTVVLGSNLLMLVLLIASVVALGHRCGGWRRGLWCGAVMAWFPPLTIGVASGNNDIVPALLVSLVLLTLHVPAVRAALVVLAGATKYVPFALYAVIVRHRSERPGAMVRVVVMSAVVFAAVIAIGMHDVRGIEVFVDRIREAQLERDDIASFWGLSGLGAARYALLVLALTVAVHGAWAVWKRGRWAAVPAGLAALLFGFAALPQFYAPYVSAVVPLAVAMLLDPRCVRDTAAVHPDTR